MQGGRGSARRGPDPCFGESQPVLVVLGLGVAGLQFLQVPARLGRDQRDVEALDARRLRGRRGHQLSFCSSAQRRSTSSRLPTLKKACSAMWSHSPSQIFLNDSMVSFSATVEPGTWVNFSAMYVFWDRNCWIRRARATTTLSSS